jgi:uncharacterized protein
LPVILSVGVQDFVHRIQSAVPHQVKGMAGIREGGVHVFRAGDKTLAYDGASGTLHLLDDVGQAVLKWFMDNLRAGEGHAPGRSRAARESPSGRGGPNDLGSHPVPQGLVSALRDRFSEPEIEEAWRELKSAVGNTLFAPDEILNREPGDDEHTSPIEAGLKSMCLDIAHDCNLSCAYCFASQGSFGGTPSLMSEETGKAAVDFLLDASKSRKYLDVDFFGGEPLLRFDTVKAVVLYALREGSRRGKEFRFTLTTNCTLLDDEKIAFLVDHGVSLILSIDGRSEVHDRMRKTRSGLPTYSSAVRRAKAAVERKGGRDYYIRGTYTRYNLDFDEDVKSLYDQGFRYISLEPAVGEGPWGLAGSDLEAVDKSYAGLVQFWLDCHRRKDPFEFYHFNLGFQHGLCKERRMTGCGAGYEYVAVTPQGEIFPCHQLVGRKEFSMGHIKNGIDRKDLMKRFFLSRVPMKPDCASCWARYLCGGGCHARAVDSTGDLLKPDSLSCAFMKNRLEHALFAQFSLSTEVEG